MMEHRSYVGNLVYCNKKAKKGYSAWKRFLPEASTLPVEWMY